MPCYVPMPQLTQKIQPPEGIAMTVPSLRRLTVDEARRELAELENQIEGSMENFEQRAYDYSLSPRERGLWQRIDELRWMLNSV